MADLLKDFLDRQARERWSWGKLDCCLFMSDWVLEVTGIDPAQEWRGKYHTEREARRLMLRCGGMTAMFDNGLKLAGMVRVPTPKIGDVGMVQVPLKVWRGRIVSVPAGAVRFNDRLWVMRQRDGLAYCDFIMVKAWSLHG